MTVSSTNSHLFVERSTKHKELDSLIAEWETQVANILNLYEEQLKKLPQETPRYDALKAERCRFQEHLGITRLLKESMGDPSSPSFGTQLKVYLCRNQSLRVEGMMAIMKQSVFLEGEQFEG